ncbi:MAG: PAS-domain containing protein [Alphaproteobacteria bacterium]
MFYGILGFAGGLIVIGILAFFILLFTKQKQKKQIAETMKKQLTLLAENLPFAIILHSSHPLTQNSADIFNRWAKQYFMPLENETQWQAIENQMSEDTARNFLRNRNQLYKEDRGFELQLPLAAQKFLVRGFHLPAPYHMHIIFFYPTENQSEKNIQMQNIQQLQDKADNIQKSFDDMVQFYNQLIDDIPYPLWFRNQAGKVQLSNKSAKALKILSYLDEPPTQKSFEDWNIREKHLTLYRGYLGTAQKQAHTPTPITETIQSANHSLLPALNNIKLAIALFDQNGRLQWFNNRLCQIWNLPAEALANKPSFQNFFYSLEEHNAFRILEPQQWLKRQLGYFKEFHGTENERLSMGDTVIEQNIVRADRQHLAWIFEDVSDNFSLQRQLRTSSDVRGRVLNSMTDALMLISSAGIIEYINPSLSEIWGIPIGFFEDRPRFSDFMKEITPHIISNDESLPKDEEGWRNLLLDRQGSHGEFELDTQNMWIYFESRNLPDGSQLIRFQNRSAEKHLSQERELRQTALQSAFERMQAFIQDVSVDIRQPTGNIQGLAEMLASQRFGELNIRQSEYANSIVSESKKLTSVMQDILDVASIDAGSFELNPQNVDIFSIIQSALELVESRIHRYQQKIKLDMPTSFTPIYADELRLKQILYNLLSLAADYSRSPGSLYFNAYQNIDENRQFFTINFSCQPNKRLHPMLNDENHYPIEVQGYIELTHRLIQMHQGELSFAYQGEQITINLALPLTIPNEPEYSQD